MFALFKPKNKYRQAASDVYAAALLHSLKPVFYEEYGVPDSFGGRFELLVLHLFMVIERGVSEEREDFNQELFDVTFANMDQTLREMGIGDMGVPKRQKKMMTAFNGRMHAYTDAIKEGALKEALKRNLYGSVEDVSEDVVEKMAQYCEAQYKALQGQDIDDIMAGQVTFKE